MSRLLSGRGHNQATTNLLLVSKKDSGFRGEDPAYSASESVNVIAFVVGGRHVNENAEVKNA